jgi:hypothetical protein
MCALPMCSRARPGARGQLLLRLSSSLCAVCCFLQSALCALCVFALRYVWLFPCVVHGFLNLRSALVFCYLRCPFCQLPTRVRVCLLCLVPRSHRNASLQLLLHAHVIREKDAPERQSQSLARSAAPRRTARARGSLRGPLRNKKREVGKGLSLADTQTGL